MKLAMLVYFAGLSESVMCALIFVTIILGFLCLIKTMQDGDIHKKSLVWFIATILLCSLLPSKETVYTMIVVSDEKIQSISKNALDVIDQKLKEIKNQESAEK